MSPYKDPEKKKAHNKAYRENHKERIIAYKKAYYEVHRKQRIAYNKAYYKTHKREIAAHDKAYRKAHKEQITARRRLHYEAHRRRITARNKAWREAHREQIAVYKKTYYKVNKEQIAIHNKKRRDADRIEVLCHYSLPSNPQLIKCAHCGKTDIDVLTLDHVNNDGWKMRRSDGKRIGGCRFARWLRLHGWPAIGLQVLCFNCNRKKEIEWYRERTVVANAGRPKERQRTSERQSERRHRDRLEALQHYSPNGKVECVLCGEDDLDVLDLDHINGRGEKKTPFERFSGRRLTPWLKQNSWPDVPLRTLCQDCNQTTKIQNLIRR